MQTPLWKPWMPRLSAFAVAMLLAASVVFWVLRWPVVDQGNTLAPLAAADDVPAANASDIHRLLGATESVAQVAAAPDASSRFQLTGVVGLGAGKGVALLAIDGKPAKAFRIGSTVDAGWVLQSVQPRSVALGPEVGGPARLLLELPRRSAQE